ncbi:MAG: glycoside hydrolase family 6 protein [Candidatus Paceibacterota bacterium]
MLLSEDDSNGALMRGAGVMKKVCLATVALATSLMFFNNINLPETASPFSFGVRSAEAAELDVWWPIDGATVRDTQPFKFSISDRDVSSYDGYWHVGSGSRNKMDDVYQTYPHKEADVSLRNWTWNEDNSYRVTFIAEEKDGTEIARETVEISVEHSEVPTKQKGKQKNEVVTLNPAPALDPVVDEEIVEGEDEEAEEATDDIIPDEEKTDIEVIEIVEGITVLSPQNNEKVSGIKTLTLSIGGMSSSDVRAYWKVGGGVLNPMQTEFSNETLRASADVDFQGWTWRSDGRYELTFVAVSNEGQSFVETIQVEVDAHTPVQTPPQESEDEQIVEVVDVEITEPERIEDVSVSHSTDNPLAGRVLYRTPNLPAERQANEWRTSRPEDAALMDIMAAEPQSMWIGGWGNTEVDVRDRLREADATGELLVLVAYNIPHRDCGLYSAGGAESATGYRSWIAGIARAIGGSNNSPVVILEPDALAGADCLSEADKAERKQLIREAIVTLRDAGATVYVEASSPPWKTTEEMAGRLQEVGVEEAHGFAMNTSSYTKTSLSIQYGEEISRLLGGMHFVVDTSRSGQGQTADLEWCNPSGRGLGERPTTQTGHELVDALLWVKSPGESDGTCNGGPRAGEWYPEQALELVKNRAF